MFASGASEVIQHVGVAQIERLQVDERFEALRILDRGVVQAQMLELCERRQPLHAFIADIEPGQRGQTGAERLELLHPLVILE